MIDKRFIIVNF